MLLPVRYNLKNFYVETLEYQDDEPLVTLRRSNGEYVRERGGEVAPDGEVFIVEKVELRKV